MGNPLNCTGLSRTVLRLYEEIVKYDTETGKHCLRVADYAFRMAEASDLDVQTLYTAGLLHDIGKIQIPISIINKPGELSEQERAIVNEHAYLGYKILKENGIRKEICQLVLLHHGLIAAIPGTGGYREPTFDINAETAFGAALLMGCDMYDAITSDRPYHAAKTPREAIQILEQKGTTGEVINFFEQKIAGPFAKKRHAYPQKRGVYA